MIPYQGSSSPGTPEMLANLIFMSVDSIGTDRTGRMTRPFGADTTTDHVQGGVDLGGKRGLVTAASAGLRVETTRVLAARGAQVVGAVRNLAKAEAVTQKVRSQAADGA